jgi:predicted short-subunit dehydrogenase-like oxidoreductase (DUF2520 family)
MGRYNISFAGAGRVAGALAAELAGAGHKILQIVSRNETPGKQLAASVNACWSQDLSFSDENNLIIVSVPDSELSQVLRQIKCNNNTYIAHTAGSYGLEVFPPEIKNRGVFYPLQTFSKGRKVDFKGLPLIIESDSPAVKDMLVTVAESVSASVFFFDHVLRRKLHLAAVFASNFPNFMLTQAKQLTLEAGLPFEILLPLVNETVTKAFSIDPEASQTGPAVRNDMNTIALHAELLNSLPESKELYLQITQAIIKHYNKRING